MLKITGYPDRYSVAPGETIEFKISLEEGDRFDARIVRVIHGDCNPAGPGLKFIHIPSPVDGSHPGRPQRIDAGSYMRADSVPPLAAAPFSFFAMIWPTLPRRADQTLAAQWDAGSGGGWRISVDAGRLCLTVADGAGKTATVATNKAMLQREWYRVAVSLDPASRPLHARPAASPSIRPRR